MEAEFDFASHVFGPSDAGSSDKKGASQTLSTAVKSPAAVATTVCLGSEVAAVSTDEAYRKSTRGRTASTKRGAKRKQVDSICINPSTGGYPSPISPKLSRESRDISPTVPVVVSLPGNQESSLIEKLEGLFQSKLEAFREEIWPGQKKSRAAAAAGSASACARDAGPPVQEQNLSEGEALPDGEHVAVDHRQEFDELLDLTEVVSEPENDDDFLKEIQAVYLDKEKEGEPVLEQLVTTFNGLFEETMMEDRRKKLIDAYLKPSNVSLASPQVNLLIWKAVNAETRSFDLKLQKLGSRMAKAAYANVYLVDLLFSAKREGKAVDLKQAIKMGMDAFALNCLAMRSLADLRRSLIKPDLSEQFRGLHTDKDKESGELLFGGDLNSRLKELKEVAKVGYGLKKAKPHHQHGAKELRKPGMRYEPQGKPFLERRPGYQRQRYPQQMTQQNYRKGPLWGARTQTVNKRAGVGSQKK